jgi:outer membrane protein TolC
MPRRFRDTSALAAALVAVATSMSVLSATAQDPPAAEAPRVQDVDLPEGPNRELAQKQKELAEEALQLFEAQRQAGRITAADPQMLQWRRRLTEARVDLARTAEERADAVKGYLEYVRNMLEAVEALRQNGNAAPNEVLEARYHVLEAERWLARQGAR